MRALSIALVAVMFAGCGTGSGVREADDPTVLEGDDIQGRDLQRIEAMIRGQVAGVEVRQVGSSWTVHIRGTNTIMGSTDPLFVIDGNPMAHGAPGALDGINPRDIQSIRVLKNVSDTAMYGARGANGVVLITTMRPPPPSAEDS